MAFRARAREAGWSEEDLDRLVGKRPPKHYAAAPAEEEELMPEQQFHHEFHPWIEDPDPDEMIPVLNMTPEELETTTDRVAAWLKAQGLPVPVPVSYAAEPAEPAESAVGPATTHSSPEPAPVHLPRTGEHEFSGWNRIYDDRARQHLATLPEGTLEHRSLAAYIGVAEGLDGGRGEAASGHGADRLHAVRHVVAARNAGRGEMAADGRVARLPPPLDPTGHHSRHGLRGTYAERHL